MKTSRGSGATPATGTLTLHVYDVGQGSTIDIPLTVGGAQTTCG